MKKKALLLKILYVTLGLTLVMVWGQSCLNKAESTVNSDAVVGLISPVEELKNGTPAEVEHYDRLTAVVRKIAHVVEYAVVGFQMMCILYLWGRQRIKDCVMCLYGGLTVALIDETIQIFAERGPLISDLWIDMGGTALGIGMAALIRHIVIKTTCGNGKP